LGTRLVASGAQSGVHSYLQSWYGLGDGTTTFNLPDLRGEFIRGWDDGRGVDVGRGFGSFQESTLVLDANISLQASVTNSDGVFSSGGAPQISSNTINSGWNYHRIRPRNVAQLICIKY
jgi:phage-related tail fiber protein